jgi:hypothetical protein
VFRGSAVSSSSCLTKLPLSPSSWDPLKPWAIVVDYFYLEKKEVVNNQQQHNASPSFTVVPWFIYPL